MSSISHAVGRLTPIPALFLLPIYCGQISDNEHSSESLSCPGRQVNSARKVDIGIRPLQACPPPNTSTSGSWDNGTAAAAAAITRVIISAGQSPAAGFLQALPRYVSIRELRLASVNNVAQEACLITSIITFRLGMAQSPVSDNTRFWISQYSFVKHPVGNNLQ